MTLLISKTSASQGIEQFSEWKPKPFRSCFLLPLVSCFHSSGKTQYWWNRSKLVKHSVSEPKRKLTGLQGELPPVPAAGEDLPPLVQGEQTESTLFAGWAVACQSLLQQVPGDGEAGSRPPELVHMPCGPRLLLALLLHKTSCPKRPSLSSTQYTGLESNIFTNVSHCCGQYWLTNHVIRSSFLGNSNPNKNFLRHG